MHSMTVLEKSTKKGQMPIGSTEVPSSEGRYFHIFFSGHSRTVKRITEDMFADAVMTFKKPVK